MSAAGPLVIAPVALPLVAAAVLLLLGESWRRLAALANLAATLAGLAVAGVMLWRVHAAADAGAVLVYLTANWPAPYGITLVADRLSVLLLVVTGVVALGAALYASAGWDRAGAHFYPLFQILLMGVNGAFLTGDLFNLFVFFEVMLAASYGLQLHGSGQARVRAGLHYIAVNLLASALFLIGLAVLYGVMGSLSMADVAARMASVPASDRGLLYAGVVIFAMAFLIKAAVWPLNGWLVPAYTTASVPVAALFVVLTKVGLYAVLRLWSLLFPLAGAAGLAFGAPVLLAAGVATLCFGAMGVLGSIRLERIAAYSVLVSSGTLLAVFTVGSNAAGSAALFYLVSATLAAGALFLLVDLVGRMRFDGQPPAAPGRLGADEDDNLDDDALPLVGRALPVSVTVLALAYLVCALLVAGLPPLAGFLSKAALLMALLPLAPAGAGGLGGSASGAAWMLIGLIVGAGLFATIALVRAGIRHFWSGGGRFAPHVKVAEGGALLVLLLASLGLTVFAEPALRYTLATARDLHTPGSYIDAVLGAQARSGAGSARGAVP